MLKNGEKKCLGYNFQSHSFPIKSNYESWNGIAEEIGRKQSCVLRNIRNSKSRIEKESENFRKRKDNSRYETRNYSDVEKENIFQKQEMVSIRGSKLEAIFILQPSKDSKIPFQAFTFEQSVRLRNYIILNFATQERTHLVRRLGQQVSHSIPNSLETY